MKPFANRLESGDVVLIDGATGTELERLGVPMVQGSWSGDSARTHADAVQAVHESHIEAGAELIIANTYASSRHLLAHGGLGEHFELINRQAVEIALAARIHADAPHVVVAGSMSTSRQDGDFPPAETARVNFADQAAILADAGAELIVLEMMRELEQTEICLEAALSTGLPVWLGWACRSAGRSEPMLWEDQHTLRDGMASIEGAPIEVVSIMHTEVADIDACLDVLDETWNGPTGVYAHSGDFVHPNWVFNGVISEPDYGDYAKRWIQRGVQVIGGCCGITNTHIAHLADHLQSR